ADDCDVFDSDVDDAPTAQTMFMANLSSADPDTDEAGPSYDSNILSEVQDHDHYEDVICTHHEEHAMHDSIHHACLFSLPERPKAENTVRLNQIVTIFLIKSSIHIPGPKLISRISIFTVNTFISLGCSGKFSRKMRRTLLYQLLLYGERKPRKGQNRIKTRQKREAWRSPKVSKAVTVNKERKKPRWGNDPGKLFATPDLLIRSSSKLSRDQTFNPTSSTNPNPKGRIRRSSKQKVENSNFEEKPLPPEVPMDENQTMAQLLQVPTDGYEDIIVIPEIAATNFELKHGLINLVQNKQFFGHDKEDSHAYLRYFNKITSMTRQRFDKSFSEAWDRFNDLLRASSHHGFSEFHQLDTFYNALNVNDQDSLNSAAGGNFLDKMPADCLKIIESKSKDMVRAFLLDKKNQYSAPTPSPTPASIKAVEPNCVTCGEKLSEMAKTPMNEHCSAVILNKLPKKLGDHGKFLIPCKFPGMDECLALADFGASINLMPLSVWKGLSLLELTLTCMTLKLADRTESKPISIAKDVKVKVAITYNLDQTSRYSANYDQMTANKIDVTDEDCEEYSQKVIGFFDVTASGSPTPSDDAIVSTTSPKLTPFGDSDFLLFEEADAFLAKTIKSSIDEPPKVELKDLPPHLEYAFLEGENKLPIIIAKELGDEEKSALIKVLKSHKRAIAWKLSNIQGINPKFCTHKILMKENHKPVVQHQRRVNPKIHDVIKKEVEKLLDAGLIYPISDSSWVSPVHCVPKKGGFTVVANEENELIPTRLVTGWREKLQELANTPLNENYSAVILKKLPKKLGDLGKFLIPYGFGKLKCKALADLGASINLMPLSVWKKLAGITTDVFVPLGRFTFPADFVIVDYESDPRVPLILGRPFLRTARALIDVHGEEMILRDGDERLTLNMRHDTSSYSNQHQKESNNLINVFNDSNEDFLEDLFSKNQ
nr:reverse transcriptase domain-containing protein [Tanacetum cinerariifolium]